MGQFNATSDVPELAKLGHVALETADLERSSWFFRDVVGLREVERVGDTVFLRAMFDREHHTLSLTAAETAGVDHVAWRTQLPEHVDGFAEQLTAAGVDVTRVAAGEEPGQGEAIRFEAPHGHPFELYYDVETPDAPADAGSKLDNRVYSGAEMPRGYPRQLDHVNLRDRESGAAVDWLVEHLGFQVNEYFQADGRRWGNWLSVTALPHDIAVGTYDEPKEGNPDAPPERFHHLAYRVERDADLFDAADRLREHGLTIDAGPGQHAITEGKYLYARDPATDIRVELYSGGYLIFDPDWEPIEWGEDDIGVAGEHQWIGITPEERMFTTVPY